MLAFLKRRTNRLKQYKKSMEERMVKRKAAIDFLLLLKKNMIGFKMTDVKQQKMMTIEKMTEGIIETDCPGWNLIIARLCND